MTLHDRTVSLFQLRNVELQAQAKFSQRYKSKIQNQRQLHSASCSFRREPARVGLANWLTSNKLDAQICIRMDDKSSDNGNDQAEKGSKRKLNSGMNLFCRRSVHDLSKMNKDCFLHSFAMISTTFVCPKIKMSQGSRWNKGAARSMSMWSKTGSSPAGNSILSLLPSRLLIMIRKIS